MSLSIRSVSRWSQYDHEEESPRTLPLRLQGGSIQIKLDEAGKRTGYFAKHPDKVRPGRVDFSKPGYVIIQPLDREAELTRIDQRPFLEVSPQHDVTWTNSIFIIRNDPV